jgi:hypothetical protein
MRTPHSHDDLPVAATPEQQAQDPPVIRHALPPNKESAARLRRQGSRPRNPTGATTNPERRYQVHGLPLPTQAICQREAFLSHCLLCGLPFLLAKTV